jgi:hypothetical protein
MMLIILENESDKFDDIIREEAENRRNHFSDHILLRLSKRYNKLEKMYVSQNKVFDPYSYSLHSHPFLSKHHFEVQMQARKAANE